MSPPDAAETVHVFEPDPSWSNYQDGIAFATGESPDAARQRLIERCDSYYPDDFWKHRGTLAEFETTVREQKTHVAYHEG